MNSLYLGFRLEKTQERTWHCFIIRSRTSFHNKIEAVRNGRIREQNEVEGKVF